MFHIRLYPPQLIPISSMCLPTLPLAVLSEIDTFTPRCSHCSTPWTDTCDYSFDYYFTNSIPPCWFDGHFTPSDTISQDFNASHTPLQCAYTSKFLSDFIQNGLSCRVSYRPYLNPDLFSYPIDRFTIDYRGLCNDCEFDLHFMSCVFLMGYGESVCKSDTPFPNRVSFNDLKMVRSKNSYYNGSLHYFMLTVGKFFEFNSDLFVEDIFRKDEGFDSTCESLSQLLDGYGYGIFPIMSRYWHSFIHPFLPPDFGEPDVNFSTDTDCSSSDVCSVSSTEDEMSDCE